jgi:hypothetical protein
VDAIRYALLVLHFVGLAAILGPALEQLRSDARRVTTVMVWGARAQLVTGLALVGVAMANDADLDHVKVAAKFLVALAIAGIAEATRKRTEGVAWAVPTVAALTVVNIVLAVFWR